MVSVSTGSTSSGSVSGLVFSTLLTGFALRLGRFCSVEVVLDGFPERACIAQPDRESASSVAAIISIFVCMKDFIHLSFSLRVDARVCLQLRV